MISMDIQSEIDLLDLKHITYYVLLHQSYIVSKKYITKAIKAIRSGPYYIFSKYVM